MKQEKKVNINDNLYYEAFKDISKVKFVKPILYIGGGLLILFIGGKIMRVLSGTVIEFKMLKSAIKS